MMEITGVKVRKAISKGTLRAVVSVTIDDAICIHDIKLIEVNDKKFVIMPSSEEKDGIRRDVCHPINTEARILLEEKVLEAYDNYINYLKNRDQNAGQKIEQNEEQ